MILITILSLGACTRWSKLDVGMEVAFAAAQTADAFQTEDITAHCAETNPIIGTCGGRANIPAYFVVTTLLHAAVTAVLPRGRWRTVWQGVTLGAEADNVLGNQLQISGAR